MWGWWGSDRIVHPVRYRFPISPADLDLPAETLRLKTSDRLTLSAWFIPQANPQGVLLLLHGYGASKADLLDLAQALHREGSFHLLLLDFRAHGDSEGRNSSFGLREVLDVEAALQHLAARDSCCALPVGCLGVSMGGSIAIASAIRFPVIRAVVADSVYADLGKTIARSLGLTYHIPRVPLGELALWGTRLRLGCRLQQLSPVRFVRRLSPKPILVIHGQQDVGVPVSEGETVYQAAGKPKQWWPVAGAVHAGCFYVEKDAYPRRVTEFFRDVLV